MAATVELSETNGNANGGTGSPDASETVHDGIGNINFGSYDEPNTIPADHKIILNSLATTYSLAKWLRFHLIDINGSTSISNLRVWKSSGAYKTNERILTNAGDSALGSLRHVTSYAAQTVEAGGASVATPFSGAPQAGLGFPSDQGIYIGLVVRGVNLGIQGSFTGAFSVANGNSTNSYSDYYVLITEVMGQSGTPSGAANQKVITFQYDES